jgi:hypothetical protein
MLGGQDAYALRCAFLHEGQADITEQKARRVIERFHFAAGRDKHLIKVNSVLLISTPRFCDDVAEAVERWTGRRQALGQSIEPDALIRIVSAGASYAIGGVHFGP